MPAEEKKWAVIRRWIWITGFVATMFAITLAIALEPSGWSTKFVDSMTADTI